MITGPSASTLGHVEFTKAHGTGNDFVVLDDRAGTLDLGAPLVQALCDRRRGVGADGVLRIAPGGPGQAATMDYRNRDGTLVEMCGNGLRVVAKYVVDRGVEPAGGVVVIGTPVGPRRVAVERGPDGRVVAATVDLGRPDLRPAAVPFDAGGSRAVEVPVDVDGVRVTLTAVSMGNPHAVVVVDDATAAPVATLGPALERHPRFPQGVNVSFAQPLGEGSVRLRVWERGVGETAACGSAACATLVALREAGHAGDEAEMHLPGGILRVRFDGDGAVLLTGAAVEVATGHLDQAWLAAARSAHASNQAATLVRP